MITILCHKIIFRPTWDTIAVCDKKNKVLMVIRTTKNILISDRDCENLVCHSDIITNTPFQIEAHPKDIFSQLFCTKDTVTIPAAALEFNSYGNTIWIQSPVGATILRIKTMQYFQFPEEFINKLEQGNRTSVIAVNVTDDIRICLIAEVARQLEYFEQKTINNNL